VAVHGHGTVESVELRSGHTREAGLLVAAAGSNPNVELALDCGLNVERGLVVDENMRTNDPAIFAAGDVAEFNGRIWGLWPVAVAQAQVAATNIAGGNQNYVDRIPMTILKGVGLDMLSFGAIEAEPGDKVVTDDQFQGFRYRKVVVRGGLIIGGVFLGFPDESSWARSAYETRTDCTAVLEAMGRGEWPTA